MSRRSLISNLISEQLAAANLAETEQPIEKPAPSPRVAAGPVRTMGLTLDRLELERKSLTEAVAAGAAVIEIDPHLVMTSFAPDRFGHDDNAAFQQLKDSIATHGQEIPILVRPLDGQPGRYQAAYGHRRLRACQALGKPVRAVVRPLTDADLVVAQGLENAARVDLSFIEKAVFAYGLEQRGFSRGTIMTALATDKTELSKLITTARAVPDNIIRAIGPAPAGGRRRWMGLADAIRHQGALARVEAEITQRDFQLTDSDSRLMRVLQVAERGVSHGSPSQPLRVTIKAQTGEPIAEIKETATVLTLQIDRAKNPDFADFVLRALPELHSQFLMDAPTSRVRR